jgi:hypothetical protein
MDQWNIKIEEYLEILNLIKFTLFLFYWMIFLFLIAHSNKWNMICLLINF